MASINKQHALILFNRSPGPAIQPLSGDVRVIRQDERFHQSLGSHETSNLLHELRTDSLPLELGQHPDLIDEELGGISIESIKTISDDEARQLRRDFRDNQVIGVVGKKPTSRRR